ncbi:MAG TPA: YCF48-related protein [Bacteroidota bacterium]|nr:YCF48-related protein [Bacteroidota bacterium]
MKTIRIASIASLAVLIFGLNESFSQPGWSSQKSGTTQSLYDVAFKDVNTGTVVGWSNTILRTVNGGAAWTAQQAGGNLLGVSFANSTTGFAVGKAATILHTTDGGATWVRQSSGLPATSDVDRVFCIDANTAVAAATGYILRTSDGGATWAKVQAANDLQSIHFVNGTVGMATTLGGRIWKTTNGGVTWTYVSPTFDALFNVCVCNASVATAVGGGGTIMRTTDGGTTWSHQTSGIYSDLWAVCFSSPSVGVAVGVEGTIIRTTDGGNSWTTLMNGKSYTLWSVCFIDQSTGFAVGDGGTILKTTSGGVTWAEESGTAGFPLQFSLGQNYPNPFNPSTTISFTLPSHSFVSLRVFDALGREVTALVSQEMTAGSHSMTWDASFVPSGLYFYRLQAGEIVRTKKMILLK